MYFEAFDMLFSLTNESRDTVQTFHALINQPQLLNNNKTCQCNTIYFNSTFASPKMAVGDVTVYHQLVDAPPASIAGTYHGVQGYQANGQSVAGTGESCVTAAAEMDAKASE